jgi:selenide,water dikinase
LCDAQTSGGLLVALPAESAEAYAAKCREGGAVSAAVVGRVVEAGEKRLRIKKN